MLAQIVPNDARRTQIELIQSLGVPGFLDHCWAEREKLQPFEASTGKWPKKFGPQRALPPLSDQPKASVAQMGKRK